MVALAMQKHTFENVLAQIDTDDGIRAFSHGCGAFKAKTVPVALGLRNFPTALNGVSIQASTELR